MQLAAKEEHHAYVLSAEGGFGASTSRAFDENNETVPCNGTASECSVLTSSPRNNYLPLHCTAAGALMLQICVCVCVTLASIGLLTPIDIVSLSHQGVVVREQSRKNERLCLVTAFSFIVTLTLTALAFYSIMFVLM